MDEFTADPKQTEKEAQRVLRQMKIDNAKAEVSKMAEESRARRIDENTYKRLGEPVNRSGEKQAIDKLGTALDRAGVPVPEKVGFPKSTAAFEEVARSDKERFDRKAAKSSGGGGGGIPLDKMDKTKKMNYKAGGSVSSASKRADGCAIRGKTKA